MLSETVLKKVIHPRYKHSILAYTVVLLNLQYTIYIIYMNLYNIVFIYNVTILLFI